MKIIRYTDPKGTICYTAMQINGSALKLAGNCFAILKISHQKAKVVRLLSPIEPSAIICIGLNYRRPAHETNAKIPESAQRVDSTCHPLRPCDLGGVKNLLLSVWGDFAVCS